MTGKISSWRWTVAGLLMASMPVAAAPADIMLTNARIYTMNKDQPKVEALAIQGGRVVATGSLRDLKTWQGPTTRLIDLKGKAVYPGFHEGHGHLKGLGYQIVRLDLAGVNSLIVVQNQVKDEIKNTPASEWVLGRGWDQNLWSKKEFPSRQDLDKLGAQAPVALTRVDGHALWVNSLALQKAGITRQTPDPVGGKIIRDAEGEATGILVDRAMDLVRSVIPNESPAQREKAIRAALARCSELGLTSFHDAGVDAGDIAVYEALLGKGELPLRMNVMLAGADQELINQYMKTGPVVKGDQQLQIRSVKLMADGALGSRGAALLEPYADQPGYSGLEIMTEEQIYQATKRFAQAGFQTAVHAIGDRTNRSVLNAFERVIKEFPKVDLRLRVEHAQILDAQDIPRFGKLGIIASVQPTHLTSDAPWVPTRIGADRMDEGAYVWQKLRQNKAVLVSGSDTPVESANPLWGLYAAVTRQNQERYPAKGWSMDQHLTMQEALESYTKNAALAAFWDKQLGTLEPGRYADIVVLDRDLNELIEEKRPQDILKARVLLTISNGRIVFENKKEMAGLRG
ncbi:MAG TPA: amidohydrolase [Oligoflexus sp.]|uniref:amidohydrolase n=1 Tax=Oligoflexus sp. TaxID=1971216 RepID=UPI002D64D9D8|nr:amidohydrolase [Oligoflexus sp.]HYX36590.1 amidohydrolase [Oligoflexus sp.]